MLAYREKDNLIHKLHPLTSLAFVGVVFVLSLVFSHPVYLLGLFLAVGGAITAGGIFQEWKSYLKLSVLMLLFLVIINALFTRTGSTVLFFGPELPVLGKSKITLEALAFAGGMGLRLLVIISIFCFYTYAVHPDKALKLLSRWGNKSVLTITLATRLFPLMAHDYRRITEVQRCRGVKLDTGAPLQRVKNTVPVFSVLLISCLERSLQLAESMYARGYGSGPRSDYLRELWRPRDFVILAAVIVSFGIGIWAALKGWSAYTYYPRLEMFPPSEIKGAVMVASVLLVPALLSWGWIKWPLLRSKI